MYVSPQFSMKQNLLLHLSCEIFQLEMYGIDFFFSFSQEIMIAVSVLFSLIDEYF